MSGYVTWGDYSRKVIAEVIDAHRPCDEAEMRKHISAAYPFGERRHWPYRCWLKAVRELLDVEYGRAVPPPADERERLEAAGQGRLELQ